METNYLELKDISLSAYLYTLSDLKFSGTQRLPSGEILFKFSPKQKAEEYINLYWQMNAPHVQPKLLFSALRDLKDMIFKS